MASITPGLNGIGRSRAVALLLAVAGLMTPARAAVSVVGFAPGTWGAADSNFGVSGFTIEDFEDVNLVPGLLVGWNTVNGNVTPAATLPATFAPATDDSHGTAFTTGGSGAWDGTRGIVNTRTNDTFPYTGASDDWGHIVFEFSSGASSVGFSLQQMEEANTLWVNGSSLGALASIPNLVNTGLRNGYVRIDGNGTSITSVEIRNAGGDGFMVDHVAFQAIPEPATYAALLGLAGLAGALARRRFRT